MMQVTGLISDEMARAADKIGGVRAFARSAGRAAESYWLAETSGDCWV